MDSDAARIGEKNVQNFGRKTWREEITMKM
jgi:hypothetical protein